MSAIAGIVVSQTADGITNVFTAPHGLSVVPTIIGCAPSNENMTLYTSGNHIGSWGVTADATNIIVTLRYSPNAGNNGTWGVTIMY